MAGSVPLPLWAFLGPVSKVLNVLRPGTQMFEQTFTMFENVFQPPVNVEKVARGAVRACEGEGSTPGTWTVVSNEELQTLLD